jgi:type II secretory ATPase GspE/PulE/Tfp pilus assembly ATPase PilB-like protein
VLKDADITAQVALWCRKLAVLLRLNVPMLLALEVVAEEFADLCDVTLQIREEVHGGASFSDAINRHKLVFSRYARVAIVAGEHSGDIVTALAHVADVLTEQARLRVRKAADFEDRLRDTQRGVDQPAITAVNQALIAAIEAGATELHFAPADDGGSARALANGAWRRLAEFAPDLYPAVVRRLKAMANIPYWIGEPSMGQMALNHNDSVWDFAVRTIPVSGAEEGRVEMTLTKRGNSDETA